MSIPNANAIVNSEMATLSQQDQISQTVGASFAGKGDCCERIIRYENGEFDRQGEPS